MSAKSSPAEIGRRSREAPAPSPPIPRGFAGSGLLAMVLINKFLLHQPLNRQSKTYAREGIEIDVSTLADRVGACVVALDPIIEVRIHVMSAQHIHADDATVQYWPKLRRLSAKSGPMFAMTGRLAARIRRRPCSTTHATGLESIPQDHLAG